MDIHKRIEIYLALFCFALQEEYMNPTCDYIDSHVSDQHVPNMNGLDLSNIPKFSKSYLAFYG